ncbi:MAG: zinc-ribbon domain-containing protein [Nitrososphaerota archaeon]|nr:zinc-ribbon domain-containing protein [Nitrososphaerota archaeon]MDG6922458.1 zinc-ribbon domain-containing protein [Nitrososphaerota archaeon]
MSVKERIAQELSLGDVVTKTFELYRRDFSKYLILFIIVEVITGLINTVIHSAIVMPKLAANPTAQQFFNWVPGFLGALISIVALSAIITLILYPIAYGGAIKIASDVVEKGQADIEASVRFAISRILWLWLVGIVVGIIVSLGLVALIVPGIILAIMFSLVPPVLIIEKPSFESLRRSRKLVGDRWLKTLAVFIVFGIIIAIAAAIAGAISAVFGVASTIVSSILSAFYLPLIPIALTVYYYSNVVRITPPQMGPPPTTPVALTQTGVRFCPNCGTKIDTATIFCPSCGAKQPS